MNSHFSSNEISNDLLTRFTEGINKFNDKDFYECHDILEDIWFEIRGDSRRFYQGLIHLAVGFYHILERKNPGGAFSQLNKGITKLDKYKPEFLGVELENLLKKIQLCISEIEKLKNAKKEEFKENFIPKIEFDKSIFLNN